MQKILRYALYGRVSSIHQKEEETIDMQKDALNSYASINNLNVVAEYYDEAQSGSLPFANRIEGSKLLTAAKKGKFDAILFYRTDRLGRNAFEGLKVCQALNDMNVGIRSISENYDTSSPTGKLVFTMLLALAENELSTIKKRMNDGKQRKLRRGCHVTGQAPYGYILTADRQLILDTTKIYGNMTPVDIVRLIFQKTIEENMGTLRVANYLNSLGIPDKHNHQWKSGSIRSILDNPKYKGIAVYNERSKLYHETITIACPPIVTADTWKAAHDGKKYRQRVNRQRSSNYKYLLGQGLMRCGNCGYAYSGMNYKERKTSRYYVCVGKSHKKMIDWKGKNPCSLSKPVPADWIEALVWDKCCQIIYDPHYLEQLLETLNKQDDAPILGPDAKDLENNLVEIKKERQSAIDLCLKNIINESDLNARLKKYDQQLQYLTDQLEFLKESRHKTTQFNKKNIKTNLALLRQTLQNIDNFEVRRAIIQSLVNSIIITSKTPLETKIEINMNFGNNGIGGRHEFSVKNDNLPVHTLSFCCDSLHPVSAIRCVTEISSRLGSGSPEG